MASPEKTKPYPILNEDKPKGPSLPTPGITSRMQDDVSDILDNPANNTLDCIYGIWNNHDNTLWEYNINTKKLINTNVAFGYAYPTVIQLQRRVFIYGGYLGDNKFTNKVKEYNVSAKSFTELAPMNYKKRCAPAVTQAKNDLIIVMAGCIGVAKYATTCDKYSVKNNKWTIMPQLHTVTCNAGAVMHKDQYIYEFNGSNIEMLDLNSESEGWKVITSSFTINQIETTYNLHGFAISKDEIILIIGLNKKDTYTMNMANKTIIRNDSDHGLAYGEYFYYIGYANSWDKTRQQLNIIGYDSIHTFDLKTRKWTGISCIDAMK